MSTATPTQVNFSLTSPCAFASAMKQGHTALIMVIVQNTGVPTTVTASDTVNGAYTQIAIGNPNVGFGRILYAFLFEDVAAAAPGANLASVVIAGAALNGMWAIEIQGAGPFDGASANQAGAGTVLSTGPVTTTENGDYLLAMFFANGQTFTPDPGWLLVDIETSGTLGLQSQVSDIAAIDATATQGLSDVWAGLLVAFRPIPSNEIAFVQAASNAPGSANIVTADFPSNVSGGDVLYASFNWATTPPTFDTMTDTMGNVWRPCLPVVTDGSINTATYWTRAKDRGPCTVAAQLTGVGNFTALRIAQLTGVDSLDRSAGQVQVGSNPQTPVVNTRVVQEILIGAEFSTGVEIGTGAGYTLLVRDGQGDAVEAMIVGAQGGYFADFQMDSPGDTTTVTVATFYASRQLDSNAG